MAALSTIVFTALPLLCFFGAKRTKKSEIFLCILFAKSKKGKKNESPLILEKMTFFTQKILFFKIESCLSLVDRFRIELSDTIFEI